MASHRYFRKCLICGTHGHPKGICPVKELNAEMEANQQQREADIKLGLTPQLEKEIRLIRLNWWAKAHSLTA